MVRIIGDKDCGGLYIRPDHTIGGTGMLRFYGDLENKPNQNDMLVSVNGQDVRNMERWNIIALINNAIMTKNKPWFEIGFKRSSKNSRLKTISTPLKHRQFIYKW